MTTDEFEKYEFREKLGTGGMGEVYRALDRSLDREVAIKILREELSASDDLIKRFQNEARTAAKLHHPNVASVYSFEKLAGRHMLVMEYVHGRTLDAAVKEAGPLPPAYAVDLFLQVLRGIGHAHSMQIAHRDIKPANILVNSVGVVKVTDFGIARVMGTSRHTVEGKMIGTIEYMSPERILNDATDLRSDIYSLGMVLYEMLAGKHPFEGLNEYQMMRAHVERPVPLLKTLGVAVPAGLEAAIQRALEKDPNRRFQNAEEFERVILPFASANPLTGDDVKATRLAAAGEFAVFEQGAAPAAVFGGAPVEPVRPERPPSRWLLSGQQAYLAIAALMVLVCLGVVAWKIFGRREAGTSSVLPPPGVFINAEPKLIQNGQSATLKWTAENAADATLEPGFGTVSAQSGSQVVTPTATTKYRITVRSSDGHTTSDDVTVQVEEKSSEGKSATIALPEAKLTAQPDAIRAGQSATLRWSLANVTDARIEPGVGAVSGDTGQYEVKPATTTSYRLTARSGSGTRISSETTVKVEAGAPAPAPAPTKLHVVLSAGPNSIYPGESATLSWYLPDAVSASIQPGIGSVDPHSGQMTVSPAQTTAYTLTARAANGATGSDTVEIQVKPMPATDPGALCYPCGPNATWGQCYMTLNAMLPLPRCYQLDAQDVRACETGWKSKDHATLLAAHDACQRILMKEPNNQELGKAIRDMESRLNQK